MSKFLSNLDYPIAFKLSGIIPIAERQFVHYKHRFFGLSNSLI